MCCVEVDYTYLYTIFGRLIKQFVDPLDRFVNLRINKLYKVLMSPDQ